MPSTVSHVSSAELLIDGYCHQIISKDSNIYSLDIFQLIKLFYLSMNGTTFKWIINDPKQLNEIFNANINLKAPNNPNAYISTGNPSALQFDSDVFEVKIDNTNTYKFFLQIYPNFYSQNNSNLINSPQPTTQLTNQQLLSYTSPHAQWSPDFQPIINRTSSHAPHNNETTHNNSLLDIINNNAPYYSQPNIDNTNSLLLTLKSLQLPPNTMRLILHIELYCLQTNAMYSTIWSVINSKQYHLLAANNPSYVSSAYNPLTIPPNKLTWPKSTLIMNEINNMNSITFQCNINILQINMRTDENIKYNIGTHKTTRQQLMQMQMYQMTPMNVMQPMYGQSIKNDLYFSPILAKHSYRFYNFYTTNNYNLLLQTLRKKLKFEWIFDNKNGWIDKIKYLSKLNTFEAIQFHSNIYYSMFCLTIKAFNKTRDTHMTHPRPPHGLGYGINDKGTEILFGIQLCGITYKTLNIIIQLKIRCKEYKNNSCLISNIIELSYDKPFYFCNNTNILFDLLFHFNQLTFDVEITIIDTYDKFGKDVLEQCHKKEKQLKTMEKKIDNKMNEKNRNKISLIEKEEILRSLKDLNNKIKLLLLQSDINIIESKNDISVIGNDMFKKWLFDIVGLKEYYNLFISNGIDSLDIVKLVSFDALKQEIGIDKYGHRLKIFNEIKKLNDS